MTASWHFRPALHAEAALSPFARREIGFFGEDGNPCWDFNTLPRLKHRLQADVFVVGANRGIDRFGHPVNHDVGEQFILTETLLALPTAVTERTKLLHDPASQSDGRVV